MITHIAEGPLPQGEDRGNPSELRRVGTQASLLEVGENFQLLFVQKCIGCGYMFWFIDEKGQLTVRSEKENKFFTIREKCKLNW